MIGKIVLLAPRRLLIAFAIVLASLVAVPVLSAQSSSPVREFRGKIVLVDRAHHRFHIRTTDGRTVRFRIHDRTHFVACRRGAMRAGWRIDVHAHRSGGAWVATRIERWHGGWSHHHADDHRRNGHD